MTNANYARGRRFEYERQKHYQSLGFEVHRSAGSHGTFDLIAIKLNRLPICIQCKVVSTDAESTRLRERWRKQPHSDTFAQILEVKVRGNTHIESEIA